jgi:hypothetical protein
MIGNTYHSHMHIYDEFGNSLFFKDSTAQWGSTGARDLGFVYQPVFNTDSGTKMFLRGTIGSAAVGPILIYSLPGTLYMPCDCFTSSGQQVSVEDNYVEKSCWVKQYPNPSNDRTVFEYKLPDGIHKAELKIFSAYGKEMKTYTISDGYSTLEVNNSDLPSGNYFYQVVLPDGKWLAKKMMVVH